MAVYSPFWQIPKCVLEVVGFFQLSSETMTIQIRLTSVTFVQSSSFYSHRVGVLVFLGYCSCFLVQLFPLPLCCMQLKGKKNLCCIFES